MTATDWRRGEFRAHSDGADMGVYPDIDTAVLVAMNGVYPAGGRWAVTPAAKNTDGLEVACGYTDGRRSAGRVGLEPEHAGGEQMSYGEFTDDDGQPHGSFEVFEGGDYETDEPGWYWWPCFPGCLPDGDPDGDPVGPFDSEAEAVADARNQ